MTRALVVYGDQRIGSAIVDGLTAKELEMVRAENKRLNAINGVRREGDEKRWRKTRRKLARKYTVKPAGRIGGAVLGAWALVWLAIFGAFGYLQAWNREA